MPRRDASSKIEDVAARRDGVEVFVGTEAGDALHHPVEAPLQLGIVIAAAVERMQARHGLDGEEFLDDGVNALVAQDRTQDPVLGVAEGGLGLDGNSGVQVLPAMPPLSLVAVGWDSQEGA